jgi:hypothetical protein
MTNLRAAASRLSLALSVLAAAGCGVTHADSTTLTPLDPRQADPSVVTVPAPPPPVPHYAWYLLHRETIDEQMDEMRTLSASLAGTDDADWLALICTTGIDLGHPDRLATYEAPDVHPDWVSSIDLTRWLIAGCATDARQSVDGVLPLLDAALARFETWRASAAE